MEARLKVISYLGIDVSKAHLDIHIQSDDTAFRVSNGMDGMSTLIERLQAYPI